MARMGRPDKLNTELRPGASIADEIIDRIRAGVSQQDASASVGIARSTLNEWLREGARQASRRLKGEALTDHETTYADFSDREARAMAEWKVEQELQLGSLSVNRPKETVTVKVDGNGQEIERSTRSERLEPDAKVIQWRLERKFPDQYGIRRLELSGPEGGPIPVSVRDEAAAALLQMVERLEANVQKARTPEVDDGG